MKKIRPGQKIKLTSVEELLGVSNEESAMDIEIAKIQPFRNHPFKVIDDEKMEDLVESIRTNGILSPVLIRPIGNDIYEMVSGHRRMHAAILLGMDRVPAIIREMTDDEAIVKMVDANIQREELLPSEKAFAYKMKMDAMKNQGYRSDLTADSKTSCQFGTKSRADQQVSGQVGESARQVQRFIRLTELIPELLDYVDQKRLQFTVAVEISYIDKEVQKWLYEYIGLKKYTHTFFCEWDRRGVGSCGSMIAAVASHEDFLLVWNHNQDIMDAVSLCSLLSQSKVLLTDCGFVSAAGGIVWAS